MATEKRTLTRFEKTALASQLVQRDEIEAVRSVVCEADPLLRDAEEPVFAARVADALVERGFINAWQASQLTDGRTRFTLGCYDILDSLGQGGTGQVFKARHRVLDRVVAVKVLPLSRSTPEAVDAFLREVRAQARLDHPNLVRALDAGQDGNVHYLVTEYVEGGDLRRIVRRKGRLGVREAASVISQVAMGLSYAHGMGLVHRDVKPGNVLLTSDGTAKLSDLGLAGPLGGDVQSDPKLGRIVGTADYLPPDLVRAPWSPSPAWDVYSLGCTLYYAVTGVVPFPKGTTRDKVRAHCQRLPLNPKNINRSLDERLVDLIAEMLAKDPRERVGSAAEVVERLRPWTEGAELADNPGEAENLPPDNGAMGHGAGERHLAEVGASPGREMGATPDEAPLPESSYWTALLVFVFLPTLIAIAVALTYF